MSMKSFLSLIPIVFFLFQSSFANQANPSFHTGAFTATTGFGAALEEQKVWAGSDTTELAQLAVEVNTSARKALRTGIWAGAFVFGSAGLLLWHSFSLSLALITLSNLTLLVGVILGIIVLIKWVGGNRKLKEFDRMVKAMENKNLAFTFDRRVQRARKILTGVVIFTLLSWIFSFIIAAFADTIR